MGVRGLKGFIEKKSQYMIQNHRLQDTDLIIDGSNVQFLLYQQTTKIHTDKILGDLVEFKKLIDKFLTNLKEANIRAVFCFDGAKDTSGHDKTRKQHERALETFQKIKSLQYGGGLTGCDPILLLPLNTGRVFKSLIVQHEMEIHFSMFEADAEIARMANERGAPVLSADSDFFLMSLSHGVINFEPEEFLRTNLSYVTCKLFKQEHFVASFSGLDKRCLPLLGICLGNDFDSLEATSERILQSYRPDLNGMIKRANTNPNGRPNRGHERIYKFLHFLSNKTPEGAIDEICKHQSSGQERLRETMRKAKEFYDVKSAPSEKAFQAELKKLFGKQNIEDISSENLAEISNYLLECLEKYTCSPVILEILNENIIFINPSLEDFSRPKSTRSCTYKIMGVIMRLLRLSSDDTRASTVYDRKGSSYGETLIEEVGQLEKFGEIDLTLQDLAGVSVEKREKLLLATFNYSFEDMESGLNAYSADWFNPQNLRQAQYLRLVMDFIDSAEPENKLSGKFKRAVFTNFLFHIKDDDDSFQKRDDDSSYLDYIEQNLVPQRSLASRYAKYAKDVLHQIIQLETVALHFNQLNSLLQDPVPPMRVDQWLNSRLIYKLATVSEDKEPLALHSYEKAQLAFD